MSQSHEHSTATDDVVFSFDRETLGALLVRYPWAFRFLGFEAALLSIAGVIPLLGEGTSMRFVVFGMVLSVALLAAVAAAGVAVVMGVRRAHREYRHGTF